MVHQKGSLEATGGGEVMHMMGHIILFGFQHFLLFLLRVLKVCLRLCSREESTKTGLISLVINSYWNDSTLLFLDLTLL